MKLRGSRVIDSLATRSPRRQTVEDGIGLGTWVSCQRSRWNAETETYEPAGAPFTAQVWIVCGRNMFVLADGREYQWASAGECTVLGQARVALWDAQDVPLPIEVAA